MTPYEEELLVKYLTHLNVVGAQGDYADFEAWYQAVRHTPGLGAPRTLEEAAELRHKDVLDAARVFKPAPGITMNQPSRMPRFQSSTTLLPGRRTQK